MVLGVDVTGVISCDKILSGVMEAWFLWLASSICWVWSAKFSVHLVGVIADENLLLQDLGWIFSVGLEIGEREIISHFFTMSFVFRRNIIRKNTSGRSSLSSRHAILSFVIRRNIVRRYTSGGSSLYSRHATSHFVFRRNIVRRYTSGNSPLSSRHATS